MFMQRSCNLFVEFVIKVVLALNLVKVLPSGGHSVGT